LTIVLGLLIILFGRKLFWLFVGFTGFFVGFDLVQQIWGEDPGSTAIIVAFVIGILGAVAAVFAQRLAITVAGFIGGGYLTFQLLGALGITSGQVTLIGTFVGAIVGTVIVGGLVDYALIVFSSVVGALAIFHEITLAPPLNLILGIALAMLGIIVQTSQLQHDEDSKD
jgi:hypothetical protein